MNRYVIQAKEPGKLQELERKILELECVHCGEIVERMYEVKNPSCFGCKMKRQKKRGADLRKKRKAL